MPLLPSLLYAPQSYFEAPAALRREVCNGCGSARAKFDFVPDTIYLMPIAEACNIHDWMYHVGRTSADRQEADVVFLGNLMRLIQQQRGVMNWLLRPFRRLRALHYYEAVAELGAGAFFAGKHA